MDEREAAFKAFLEDIREDKKEYYAGFLCESYIYQAFAVFGRTFLANNETQALLQEQLGDEDPVEKDELINALQRLYDEKIPQKL